MPKYDNIYTHEVLMIRLFKILTLELEMKDIILVALKQMM
jgi:hypothetical protein